LTVWFPEIKFPRMALIRQIIDSPKLDDFVSEIRRELGRIGLRSMVKPGMRIAITAGSRGIAHYPEILATIVDEVRKAGGIPFLIPAMGSHGGATVEGQLEVLRELGITPDRVGAPILATMEVEEVGRIDGGIPVYVDKYAVKADGIIVVGRVKPHTDFKDRIESGLMKMMAIGLGKHKGAETIHMYKSEGYHRLIPLAARLIMEKLPILFGLAIVENAFHEIAIVKAIEPKDIEEEEAKLLEKAKELLARIPFKDIDVLIVDEIGKDISGAGMDTNVVGRFWLPGESDPRTPSIKVIVVLDLTEKSHGNAVGIGLADITTEKLVRKIDYRSTFINSLTSGHTITAKIPIFLPTDRDAVAAALYLCRPIDPREARVVRIKNTLELERIWISESLYDLVVKDPMFKGRIEVLKEPEDMVFDEHGDILPKHY